MQSSIFELTGQEFNWRCKHCRQLAYRDFHMRIVQTLLRWFIRTSSSDELKEKSQKLLIKLNDVRQNYIDETIRFDDKLKKVITQISQI